MHDPAESAGTPQFGNTPTDANEVIRHPYVRPALEALGNWNVLTLQQSVGIAYFRAPSIEDEMRSGHGEG